MLGDEGHFELRDLAALYLHAGDLPAAVSHLSAYAKCSAAQGKGHMWAGTLWLLQPCLCVMGL